MRLLLPSRLLGEITSSPGQQQQQAINPNPHFQNPHHQGTDKFDSDIVVILSALLCAVICVLGLFAAARCTWLRHFSAGRPLPPLPPPTPPPTSGLNEKVLESLPKATYGPHIHGKLLDCAICLADFARGDEVRVLPHCGHGFHVLCIDTWLGVHSSCPSCRRILVSAKCGCQTGGDDLAVREQHTGDYENRSFP